MKEQEILEGNKLIAEFMGEKISGNHIIFKDGDSRIDLHGNSLGLYVHSRAYNVSWDWLMPVVEKIESLGYALKIIQNNCFIYGSTMGDHTEYFKNVGYGESKLESTWLTVVEFIKWYNENKRIKKRN